MILSFPSEEGEHMKNQINRDIFTELYRVFESHEIMPPPSDIPRLTAYFKDLGEKLGAFDDKYAGNPVAHELAIGLMKGLNDLADLHGREVFGHGKTVR